MNTVLEQSKSSDRIGTARKQGSMIGMGQPRRARNYSRASYLSRALVAPSWPMITAKMALFESIRGFLRLDVRIWASTIGGEQPFTELWNVPQSCTLRLTT